MVTFARVVARLAGSGQKETIFCRQQRTARRPQAKRPRERRQTTEWRAAKRPTRPKPRQDGPLPYRRSMLRHRQWKTSRIPNLRPQPKSKSKPAIRAGSNQGEFAATHGINRAISAECGDCATSLGRPRIEPTDYVTTAAARKASIHVRRGRHCRRGSRSTAVRSRSC